MLVATMEVDRARIIAWRFYEWCVDRKTKQQQKKGNKKVVCQVGKL